MRIILKWNKINKRKINKKKLRDDANYGEFEEVKFFFLYIIFFIVFKTNIQLCSLSHVLYSIRKKISLSTS